MTWATSISKKAVFSELFAISGFEAHSELIYAEIRLLESGELAIDQDNLRNTKLNDAVMHVMSISSNSSGDGTVSCCRIRHQINHYCIQTQAWCN